MKKLALVLAVLLTLVSFPVQAKEWITFTAVPGSGKQIIIKWDNFEDYNEPNYKLQLEVQTWYTGGLEGLHQGPNEVISLPNTKSGTYPLSVVPKYVHDLDKNNQKVILRLSVERPGTNLNTEYKKIDVTEMVNPQPHTPGGVGSVTNGNGNTNGNSSTSENNPDIGEPEEGGVFEKAVAELVEAITAGIYAVGGLLGFQELGKLIMGVGDLNIAHPHPFKPETWAILDDLYAKMTLVAFALSIGMVFATALRFMRGAFTAKAKEEAMESVWRWAGVLGIMIVAPVIVRLIFVLNGFLVSGISEFVTSGVTQQSFDPNTMNNLRTGHILATAIAQMLFAVMYFKVNLVFFIRDWVIYVLYVFTPIMAILWGINKNVTAASVWVGEVLSNGFLQTAYCIVLSVILLILSHDPEKSSVHLIVGVYMLSALAGMLRNGLQGLWTRWAGIDEERMAGGFTGAMGAMLALPARAENLHRLAEFETDESGRAKKIYPGDVEIGSGLKPSRRIETDGIRDVGYANETSASYSAKDSSESLPGYKTKFDETDFHGTGLIDAINRGRKAYTAVSAGVQTALTPFLAPMPGGERIANFMGFAAGKAAQRVAMPATYWLRVAQDRVKYDDKGLSLGAAIRGNIAPDFGEGFLNTGKALASGFVVGRSDWLNPNWTPAVASTLTRRNLNNESVWKI